MESPSGSRRAALAIGILLAFPACVTTREPVRALPVGEASGGREGPSAVVRAFTDARGAATNYALGTTLVPVLNLFYLGNESLVPEQSAAIESFAAGGRTQVTGALERDLPYLLAHLAANATFVDDAAGRLFDYEVSGTLERSAVRTHVNMIPGALLAWIGVPFQYVDIELQWRMQVFRCGDRTTPVWSETYQYTGKKVTGAYYHRRPARGLLIAALQETLARAREDLERAMATGGPCAALPVAR